LALGSIITDAAIFAARGVVEGGGIIASARVRDPGRARPGPGADDDDDDGRHVWRKDRSLDIRASYASVVA